MVFSSIPPYLDPLHWQQQANQQAISCTIATSSQLLPLQPPTAPPPQHIDVSGGTASIRPGSMADRARIANVAIPETALKCPRCESTNTKFCYFNNYSLTQPRHFCKTCRRYWTRGGTLRNVPVGGGFRRNRRSKSHSESPVSSDCGSQSEPHPTLPTPIVPHHLPALQFALPSLHQLTEFPAGEMGLNYGLHYAGDSNGLSSGRGRYLLELENWRFQQSQQMAVAGGLDGSIGRLFGGGDEGRQRQLSSVGAQVGLMKLEEKEEGNLGIRQYLGVTGVEQQYWNGAGSWADLSPFTSSHTNNFRF